MIVLWLCLAFLFGMLVGAFLIIRYRSLKYHGVITMEETAQGLVYSLTVNGDPELLANHKEARFKIVSPSYTGSRE